MAPGKDFAPNNTPYEPLIADRDGTNFTFESLHSRVPHILTDIINDFYTAIQDYEGANVEATVSEGKELTSALSKLKHEMVTDKQLTALEEDGVGDVAVWNEWLTTYFPKASWYSTPFLAWETYMYRRIATIFKRSVYWKDYDFFVNKKQSTFMASMVAVAKLCSRVDALTKECKAGGSTKLHLGFVEMLQASLWGNQTDLSMFPDLSNEALEEMQARISSGENDSKVVSNDAERIWKLVSQIKGGRFDIVLDNSGFELLQDVLLAHWLVELGFASKVVFHPKRIPWYVSDVTNEDFHWLVSVAQDPSLAATKAPLSPADAAALKSLGGRWAAFLADGTWELKDELFWTGPYGFRYLPTIGKDVWENELTKADVVIFKGDLNYRKLTYDQKWPVSTPFVEALGPIATDPNAPAIVALRTSKCDTITGVAPERAEALFRERKDWMYSGQYGVIQLSPGRWAEKI
ncbi:Hairy/enhancer-of-split with YRPW motif protein 2 [Coemansia sp. RSA 1813]|nr:Hairy/enhancer-of-split with YRPW motif protein 2 [Coemansia sp. RSA 1646]KAJ1770531.1 Hairy/enhancer-of-split with YRPW motif protein 2 [Coemansia sp. RSA 1843]KAJ2092931.1 Hairy/enhancer-of-split with YRPW motif protein 2 [Coemansia sp. RSA 986]KAJ2216252.1 Hairy/enhancer-of-split with YRPW motif protein 2 [Coemansia sp. RSA 487]KAJ2570575.1 Hairy/enhancer-of-split with YRPW motif protein 2 [Coemansia sp. RSA 1813]